MNITQSKNNLAQFRSRTRLYETLVRECEALNFEYDTSKSFAHNAGRAGFVAGFEKCIKDHYIVFIASNYVGHSENYAEKVRRGE